MQSSIDRVLLETLLPEADRTVMLEVLEHIPNPEEFLKLIEKKQENRFSSVCQTQGHYASLKASVGQVSSAMASASGRASQVLDL